MISLALKSYCCGKVLSQNAAHLVSYYFFPSIKKNTEKTGRDVFLLKSGRNISSRTKKNAPRKKLPTLLSFSSFLCNICLYILCFLHFEFLCRLLILCISAFLFLLFFLFFFFKNVWNTLNLLLRPQPNFHKHIIN